MIEKIYNESIIKKEPAANSLVNILLKLDNKTPFKNSTIYHHFPIYPNQEGEITSNANILFVSQDHGIIIFQCIHFNNRFDKELLKEKRKELEEIDRLLFAKIFKDAPNLQKNRRALKFEIAPCFYFFEFDIDNEFDVISDMTIFTNADEIEEYLEANTITLTSQEITDLKATIEGSKGIIKPSERKLKDKNDIENSKGAILTKIENSIYNFDLEQKRAALFILDGPQRIRGLAGSGKTVILAMKAALIHLQKPDAEILYTYYTKNLYDLVKRLITRFYRQFAEKDPNWERITIMHAWGGIGLQGVYSNACINNNIRPINLLDAKKIQPSNPFGYVCKELNKIVLKKQYDYALLDEAQDFPAEFYRVCRQTTRNNRVVWAYDDFQNILDVNLQSEKETFGKDENGEWYIDFSKSKETEIQDLVLHKCYRNPKEILVAAFALGLGIYNIDTKTGNYKVLQRLENNEHWESLGFNIEQGESKDGDLMILSRPNYNSSELKNSLLTKDLIKINGFSSYEEECAFVSEKIIEDLDKELKPEDITVICVDDRYSKKYFSFINKILSGKKIKIFNLQEQPSDTTIFKLKDHVTFSTIYKAKGNESGSVHIIGIDSIFSNKDDIIQRNKIFTAMTRSQGWVSISGMSKSTKICEKELENLVNNGYKLIFKQPSEEEVKTIHQDINKTEAILNTLERMYDQYSKELNLSKEEIVEMFASKINRKK